MLVNEAKQCILECGVLQVLVSPLEQQLVLDRVEGMPKEEEHRA